MRLPVYRQVPDACAGNLRNAWKQLKEFGSNDEGRDHIKEAMQLCPAAKLSNDDDVDNLAQWAQNAFDYLVSHEPWGIPSHLSSLCQKLTLAAFLACDDLVG
jgi:hypothetical protein